MTTVFLTGGSSGVGQALNKKLTALGYNVIAWTRDQLDLNNVDQVHHSKIPVVDIVINCAGHDLGGKQPWLDHKPDDWLKIINTNIIAPMLICHQALHANPTCKLINITSTNNNKYYSNDLVYSLTKQALATFGQMLAIDYPGVDLLEVQLGLTQTNFNNNRYRNNSAQWKEIYNQPCLDPNTVADNIIDAIKTNKKFIKLTI